MARLQDFDAYLRQNAIPISGLSDSGGARPAAITIQFLPEATAEQIAWAEDSKTNYDWRERRMLTRNQIVSGIQTLTAAQQNTIIRHMIASFIREHKSEVLDALAVAGILLVVDEVDPNPPPPI